MEHPVPPNEARSEPRLDGPVDRTKANGSSGLWVSLVVFVGSLFVPALLELVTDVPWFVALGISAFVGALALWNLNIRYERRLKNRTIWTRSSWLRQQIPFAMGGVVTAVVGAILIRIGSTTNTDWLVAVALGIVIGGLMVVARVVEVDLGKVVGTDELFPQQFSAAPKAAGGTLPAPAAWGLNVGLIGGASLLSMFVVAFSVRGLAIGLAIVILWVTAVWTGRARATPRWTAIGFGLVAAPPLVMVCMAFADQEISGIVLYFGVVVMLVGMVIVSARQRSLWPEQDTSKSPDGPSALDELDRRDLVLAAGGTLALLVGIVWWWVVVSGPGVSLLFPRHWRRRRLPVRRVAGDQGRRLSGRRPHRVCPRLVVERSQVGPQPAVEVDSGEPVMVAFGDSYMSGEGIGRFYDGTNTADSRDYAIGGTNDCRRSPAAYSPLLAAELGFALSFDACSGAKAMSNELADELLPIAEERTYLEDLDLSQSTLADYLDVAAESGEGEKNSIIGQLLRWRQIPPGEQPEPDLVLLSLGGNDAGFSGIGQACFLPGSCREALNARSDDVFGRVSTRTAVALAAVAGSFPDAEIAVVAYPQMFGEAANECAGQVPFDATEVSKLAETVEDLNAAVFAGVNRVQQLAGDRVSFLSSTSAAFDGHRFCEPAAKRVADIAVVNTIYLQAVDGPDLLARIIPGKLIHNTFHPTTRGHQLLGDALCKDVSALREAITGAPTDAACRAPGEPFFEEEPDGLMAIPASDEVAEGICNDFDKYVYCSIVGWAQRVAIPIVLLILGGASAARWVDRNNLLLGLLARLRKNKSLSRLVRVIPIGES